MKIYGYADESLSVEQIEPRALAEITLVAIREELRSMASFLAFAEGHGVHGRRLQP